jgi:sugar phosphate isomerase/epimerase
MPNIGYHAVYESDFKVAIKSAADNGFQYVQFDLNVPKFYLETLSRNQINDLKSYTNDLNIKISFHAPGDNVGFFTDYPLIQKGLIDHIKVILQKANELNAHHLTVHPLSPPSFRRADTLTDTFQVENEAYYRDVLIENLTKIAEASGNVSILVENYKLGKITTFALEQLFQNDTRIYLALDWPKMHTTGALPNEDQQSFYLKYKKRILELHLHDMDNNGRSHLKPGQGALNFEPLFRKFYNHNQWLTIEIRPFLEAAKSKPIFEKIIEKWGT